MIILDSNIWLAFIDKDDSQNKKSQTILEGLNPSEILLPDAVYFEILTVLRVRKGSHLIPLLLQLFEDHSINVIASYDFIPFALEKICIKENHNLSFVDCLLWSYAQNGYSVITFDQELEKQIKQI